MKIRNKSYFKDEKVDAQYFENWVEKLETCNSRKYERFEMITFLGKTHVWGLNTKENNIETLVIFPGSRTTSLIWYFDKRLKNLNQKH